MSSNMGGTAGPLSPGQRVRRVTDPRMHPEVGEVVRTEGALVVVAWQLEWLHRSDLLPVDDGEDTP